MSGKWSRWMARESRREARTQGAPIAGPLGATEDTASRRETSATHSEPLPGQAPSGVDERALAPEAVGRPRAPKPPPAAPSPARPLAGRRPVALGAVALAAVAVAAGVVAFMADATLLLVVALALGVLAAVGLSLYLIGRERRRHERVEVALAGQASFLESLVDSMAAIASTLDPDEILELTRREAERLFDARATLLAAGETSPRRASENAILIPLRVRDAEIGAMRLSRHRSFRRSDSVRATVLADFAARAIENARLLAEAQVREAERARLSDKLITAEQEERRRLALVLHDTAVQSLSGIALMLDAGLDSIDGGRLDDAKTVIRSALARHRDTIRSLRDLSFNLEPVVLRDQGFGPAVRALADQLGLERQLRLDIEVEAAEALAEPAQAALYQIIREALHGAISRGPPTWISVRVEQTGDGGFGTIISDDAPGERRRAIFDSIAERARTLNGRVDVDQGADGGTTVRVTLPPYSAQG
jgi:signal transduction histidine kinase